MVGYALLIWPYNYLYYSMNLVYITYTPYKLTKLTKELQHEINPKTPNNHSWPINLNLQLCHRLHLR